MNESQHTEAQREPLTNDMKAGQPQLPNVATLDCRGTLDQSNYKEKNQLKEIQELKLQHNYLQSEAERLHTELRMYKAALQSEETSEAGKKNELRDKFNELKRQYDSRQHNASLLEQKIYRRENLMNRNSLMAGYVEEMNNWKTDEQELSEKRQCLSIRLEQVRQQAVDEMAKARQAETEAATVYAQAVAWGDTEGEKNANIGAVKAAKNLTTATEQNRRQQLIITALANELATVDRYILEAQEKHTSIEKKALHLAHTVLEEKWNYAAEALLEVGGKLWASYQMIGLDPLGLMKLIIPEQGENFRQLKFGELSDRSYKHTINDVLKM